MTTTKVWGWKNLNTGTICQTVTQASAVELFKDAGLDVPHDPLAPTKHNFQAVPVLRHETEEKQGRKKVVKVVVEEDRTK